MAQQITYDKAYDTIAPEDFPAMLEVPRYGRRSDAFDGIISARFILSANVRVCPIAVRAESCQVGEGRSSSINRTFKPRVKLFHTHTLSPPVWPHR